MEGNYCMNDEDSLIQILLWLPVVSLLRFKSVCKSWRAIIENPFFIHNHATFQQPKPKPKPKHTTTFQIMADTLLLYRFTFRFRIGNIFTVSGDDFEVFGDLGTPPPPYYNRDHHFNDLGTVSGGDDEEEELLEDLGTPPPPLSNNRFDSHPFSNISVVGCCNGIICLHNHGYSNDIFLWNPAIKKCRFLPKPIPLEGNRELRVVEDVDDVVCYFVGFGFDFKTKDYKVLRIASFIPDVDENMDDEEKEYRYARGVQVYSLITDSWKTCKDTTTAALSNLIMPQDYWDHGHCLNGNYLFIAGYLYEEEEEGKIFQEATNSRQKCFKPVIVSFDFTEENFRTIQFPLFDSKNKTHGHNYLILFGEKIALTNACTLADHPSADGFYSQSLEIWVLNEYGGNDQSWSKFYTFTSTSQPKFITDNGEFILLDGAKLQLLNSVTGELKDLQYDCQGSSRLDAEFISRVGVYKRSLVPIAGNDGTDNNNNLQV